MATSGLDNISGAGLIQADLAMKTFASPTPILIFRYGAFRYYWRYHTTFTVTVQGQFITPSSLIYLRDQPLPTTVAAILQRLPQRLMVSQVILP